VVFLGWGLVCMSFCRTWSLWDGEVGGTAGRLDDGMLHAWLCNYMTPWVVVDWWWVWNLVSVFLSRGISVTRSFVFVFVFVFLVHCRSRVSASHEDHTTSTAVACREHGEGRKTPAVKGQLMQKR
jgi:hypothetical protein